MPAFDPDKFINCGLEQRLFEELLRFQSDLRILSIKDAGMRGKSSLLEKFRHHCRTLKKPIPVSLIALDQLEAANPITFVKRVVDDLRQAVNFTKFTEADGARLSGNFSTVMRLALSLDTKGIADFRGAQFQQGAVNNKIAGVMNNYDIDVANINIEDLNSPRLNDDQEKFAQDVCFDAFEQDFIRYLSRPKKSAVIILDAYDRCDTAFREWLITGFFTRYIFNSATRRKRLAVIIAGQEVPLFHAHWPTEACSTIIKSVNGLSRWEEKDIRKCLQDYGVDETHAEHLYNTVYKLNIPPMLIIQIAQSAAITKQANHD